MVRTLCMYDIYLYTYNLFVCILHEFTFFRFKRRFYIFRTIYLKDNVYLYIFILTLFDLPHDYTYLHLC